MFANKLNTSNYKLLVDSDKKRYSKPLTEAEISALDSFIKGLKVGLYNQAMVETSKLVLKVKNGCEHVLFKSSMEEAVYIKNSASTANIWDFDDIDVYYCPNCGQRFIKIKGENEVISFFEFVNLYISNNGKEELEIPKVELPIVEGNKYMDVSLDVYPSFLYLRALIDSEENIGACELAEKIQIFSDQDSALMDKVTEEYNKKLQDLGDDAPQDQIDVISIDYSKKMERVSLGLLKIKLC